MATTLLEYFNELRTQNPFSWVKDSEVTTVEPGHAEMTLQTMKRSTAILEGICMVLFVLVLQIA